MHFLITRPPKILQRGASRFFVGKETQIESGPGRQATGNREGGPATVYQIRRERERNRPLFCFPAQTDIWAGQHEPGSDFLFSVNPSKHHLGKNQIFLFFVE
jgi:hypothetical protein